MAGTDTTSETPTACVSPRDVDTTDAVEVQLQCGPMGPLSDADRTHIHNTMKAYFGMYPASLSTAHLDYAAEEERRYRAHVASLATPTALAERRRRSVFLELYHQTHPVWQQSTVSQRKMAHKREQRQRLCVLEERAKTDAGIATGLTRLMSTPVPDLRRLCRHNQVMTAGIKVQLVERLMQCALHGSPGPCPQCHTCESEVVYDTEGAPQAVRCHHELADFDRVTPCGYVREYTGQGAPFRDTPDRCIANAVTHRTQPPDYTCECCGEVPQRGHRSSCTHAFHVCKHCKRQAKQARQSRMQELLSWTHSLGLSLADIQRAGDVYAAYLNGHGTRSAAELAATCAKLRYVTTYCPEFPKVAVALERLLAEVTKDEAMEAASTLYGTPFPPLYSDGLERRVIQTVFRRECTTLDECLAYEADNWTIPSTLPWLREDYTGNDQDYIDLNNYGGHSYIGQKEREGCLDARWEDQWPEGEPIRFDDCVIYTPRAVREVLCIHPHDTPDTHMPRCLICRFQPEGVVVRPSHKAHSTGSQTGIPGPYTRRWLGLEREGVVADRPKRTKGMASTRRRLRADGLDTLTNTITRCARMDIPSLRTGLSRVMRGRRLIHRWVLAVPAKGAARVPKARRVEKREVGRVPQRQRVDARRGKAVRPLGAMEAAGIGTLL
ncbi:hypothetical protein KIPB_001579 [Kipferlia bialata]|uniref:Uncharacterized protein n=1 Tax=Kipferlia bialata TaxID=797122 RepID=A0A9K3CP67_9EUKA|nr:hypothetical protein KIPB_001579 [Kipferlia bialata]|eukprot:g1579.t1